MLNEGCKEALLDEGGVDDGSADDLRVHVRGRASVLDVALLLGSSGGGDAHRAVTVVVQSKTLLVIAVKGNVEDVLGCHLLDHV